MEAGAGDPRRQEEQKKKKFIRPRFLSLFPLSRPRNTLNISKLQTSLEEPNVLVAIKK